MGVVAFVAILVLFLSTSGILGGGLMEHAALFEGHELPYGWIGVLAAMHFGLWYYLGIEGTTQAAEEVRSPARSLPFGTLAGIMTLLIAATLTWYVCAGLMPWEYLGQAGVPLFDAGRLSGSTFLLVLLVLLCPLMHLFMHHGHGSHTHGSVPSAGPNSEAKP